GAQTRAEIQVRFGRGAHAGLSRLAQIAVQVRGIRARAVHWLQTARLKLEERQSAVVPARFSRVARIAGESGSGWALEEIDQTLIAFEDPFQREARVAGLRRVREPAGGDPLAAPVNRLRSRVRPIDARPHTFDVLQRALAESERGLGAIAAVVRVI